MFEDETHPMFLKFTTQVHPFPFLDSVVELRVALFNDTGRIVKGRDVAFNICLQYVDDPHSNLASDVEILNPSAQVVCGKTGVSPTLQIKFLTSCCSIRPYVLTLFPAQERSIVPSSSSHIQVVSYRMSISNEQDIVTPWFKDEGGKGNQIVLNAALINSHGNTVTTRPGMKLKATLFYDDDEKVANQNILKISADTKMFLGGDGQATIKCRVEEISGNHDNRRFKVMVSPDTIHNPANNDVSYIFTPEILVKSKISKKNREERLRKQQEQQQEEEGGGGVQRSVGSKRKCTEANSVRNMSPANLPGQMSATGAAATSGGYGGDAAALLRLQEFAAFTVRTLETAMQHMSPTDASLAAMEQILAKHRALAPGLVPGLSAPPSFSRSSSGMHVSFGEMVSDDDEDDYFSSLHQTSSFNEGAGLRTPLAQSVEAAAAGEEQQQQGVPEGRVAGGSSRGSLFDLFRMQPRGGGGSSSSRGGHGGGLSMEVGPAPSRDNSLFQLAASSVSLGPVPVRGNSLFLPEQQGQGQGQGQQQQGQW
jgi:hypothetical protein